MTVLNENLLYRVLNFFNSRNIVMTNFCKIKLNLSCQVVGGVSVLSSQNFRCLIYRIGYLGNIEVNSSAVSFYYLFNFTHDWFLTIYCVIFDSIENYTQNIRTVNMQTHKTVKNPESISGLTVIFLCI